jgi:hypothetical protein
MAGITAKPGVQFRALVGVRRRLATRYFKGRKHEALAAVFIPLVFLPILIMTATGLYAAFTHAPEPWPIEILGATLTLLWGMWILFPMFMGSFSETLDLTKLMIYPLRRRELVSSMVVGTVFDLTTFLTIPIFWSVLAAWSKGVAFPFGLLALVVLWANMVIGYELVATTLVGVFQSRRFREFVIVFATLLGVTMWSLHFWIDNVSEQFRVAFESGTLSQVRPLDVLQWVPPGAVARAISLAKSGNYAPAFGWLAYAAVFVPPLMWLWWRVLVRVTMQGGMLFVLKEGKRRRERVRVEDTRPQTGFAIMVTKELRIWWRAPRLRMQLFQALLMPIVFAFLFARGETPGEAIAFAPAIFVFMATTMAYNNVLGSESHGIATVLISPLRRERIFQAKAAAFGTVIAIPYVLGVVAALILTPGPLTVAGAFAGICVVLVALTVFNFASTLFPWPMPDDAKRGFGNREGGFQAMVAMVLSVFAVGVVVSPVGLLLVAAAIGGKTTPAIVVSIVSVFYGALVFYFGTKGVARTFMSREPDIYQALKPKQQS